MKERITKVINRVSLLGILGLLYYLFGKITGLYIPCVFLKVTGLYCPGCGVTRMFIALLEGDFYRAFRSNEVVFLLLPFFIIGFFMYIIRYIKADTRKQSKVESVSIYLVLVIVILFGIVRNIPQFGFLQPVSENRGILIGSLEP
jgi:hypothetical protein